MRFSPDDNDLPVDDDISYEDFDDVAWMSGNTDEIEVINLDEIDAEIQDTADQPAETADEETPRVGTESQRTSPVPRPPLRRRPSSGPAARPGMVWRATPAPTDTRADGAPETPEAPASATAPADTGTTPDDIPAEAEDAVQIETDSEVDSEPASDSLDKTSIIDDVDTDTWTDAEEVPDQGTRQEPDPDQAQDAAPTPAQSATSPASVPAARTSTPSASENSTGAPIAPAAPEAPPVTVYRLQLSLPTEASARVLELRTAGKITTMPPPGIALSATFRSGAIEDLVPHLEAWARSQLPLQIEARDIVAEVRKAQQYVAAWELDVTEELNVAQRALHEALSALVTPAAAVPAVFTNRLTIGSHVSPTSYPALIGAMQRDFEPMAWIVEELALVRMLPEVAPGEWEMVQTFT